MSRAASPGRPPSRPRGRPRADDYAEKRNAVLDAAAGLLRRNGYARTSLADLADLLQVTKPTLYHYVGSKEQLVAEIVDRSQQMTIAFMREVAASPGSGADRLRRILVGYIEIVNSDAGTGLIFADTAALGPQSQASIHARSQEANAVIYAVMAEGRADGTLAYDDASLVLHTLFGAANWTPNWYRPGGRLKLAAFAEDLADILLGGVLS